MKKRIIPLFFLIALGAMPVLAHRMAADIPDEEIYAMIDALVAHTPHADLVVEKLGGITVMTVTTNGPDVLSDFLDDGGLGYIEELDGTTYIDIGFNDDGTATLTVQQYK